LFEAILFQFEEYLFKVVRHCKGRTGVLCTITFPGSCVFFFLAAEITSTAFFAQRRKVMVHCIKLLPKRLTSHHWKIYGAKIDLFRLSLLLEMPSKQSGKFMVQDHSLPVLSELAL